MQDPNDEIRQILQWLKDNPTFLQAFIQDPETNLNQLEARGFAIADRTRRHFLNRGRITAENFAEEYERYFSEKYDREGKEIPTPNLPFPLQSNLVDDPTAGDGPESDTAPERLVNTGFATPQTPAEATSPFATLAKNTPYYFWFEVGERMAGSIETKDVELLPENFPVDATLQVALFAFPKGLEITRGSDVGEITLRADGRIVVAKPVAKPDAPADLLERRLFFPVKTPANTGPAQMRCNIYYQQTLVQSRLITVQVEAVSQPSTEQALKSDADYVLSKTFNGRQLNGMGQNRLSLMLNDNGDGTHGFRFFGEKEFKNDASFDADELTQHITKARGALRRASWGDEEEYADGKTYLYGGPLDETRLRNDLVSFAMRGYRFYDALINRLAGDSDKAWELQDLMLKPGQVQIASKESARLVMPAAMFYDYPLDDGRKTAEYSLCPAFLTALKGNEPLEKCACFQGNCPTREQDTIICPSGFWGFRHSLGFPVTVSAAPDAPSKIPATGKISLAVSVSTDPNFRQRPSHEQALQKMGFGWEYADTRDNSLTLLKNTHAQIVYYYCHGGFADGLPFLSVGPKGEARITRANLRDKRIRWQTIRPFVFINGCHTTSLSPEVALDLVSGFIEVSHAAGVMGTEITIFEPIAVAFAEECFRRFLIEGQTLGDAVRGARLTMLKNGNPLGLVYIPYAMAGLQIEK